jgi:hypothetical protein
VIGYEQGSGTSLPFSHEQSNEISHREQHQAVVIRHHLVTHMATLLRQASSTLLWSVSRSEQWKSEVISARGSIVCDVSNLTGWSLHTDRSVTNVASEECCNIAPPCRMATYMYAGKETWRASDGLVDPQIGDSPGSSTHLTLRTAAIAIGQDETAPGSPMNAGMTSKTLHQLCRKAIQILCMSERSLGGRCSS